MTDPKSGGSGGSGGSGDINPRAIPRATEGFFKLRRVIGGSWREDSPELRDKRRENTVQEEGAATSPIEHRRDALISEIFTGWGVSPILSIRFSIDKKVIAVQRSDYEIQFFHRETKQILNHKCRAGSESILGFFWSDSPLCDLAIVKTSGMDLFACDSMLNLCLVETKKVNVNWYEPDIYLIYSAGVVRLPRFEMTMARSESNSQTILYLWPNILLTSGQGGYATPYMHKFVFHITGNQRFYDLFMDSRAPVSAPLPLLWRGHQGSDTSSLAANKEIESPESSTSSENIVMYEDAWTFLAPDLILDQTNK
ncbi:hypothetical protein F2Q69_00031869, partial [Brassica cretica]